MTESYHKNALTFNPFHLKSTILVDPINLGFFRTLLRPSWECLEYPDFGTGEEF
jgi:hypothetical protein